MTQVLKNISRYGHLLYGTIIRLNGSAAAIVMTPPSWKARLSRWLVAFVALTLVYQFYSMLIVPWIEPVSRSSRRAQSGSQIVRRAEHPELAKLFAEDAWERNHPKVLETQQGKLLFQNYRPSPDGRLELRPCTLIFHTPGSDSKRRTIVLQSPKGALLSFTGPLDLARAKFSRLKGARLEGEILIFSPPSHPGANDALKIVTRNVQILPRQIWTPHDVVFQYGAHHGSGRDLSITLAAPDIDGEDDSPKSGMGNLQLMELVHVDKLVLQVPGRGLLARPDSDMPSSQTRKNTSSESQVEVTCQGPFQFDFMKGIASFEEQVDVVRLVPDGPSDQLNCARLQIHFDIPRERDTSTTKPLEKTAGEAPLKQMNLHMAVRRIEAFGQPVQLRAPSVEATARGQRLEYDFQTQTIRLEGSDGVLFTYRRNRVKAPKLEYQLNRDQRRLGRLWASGPGTYEGRYGEDDGQQFHTAWNGDLQLQPQDDLHVLSIEDGARITFNGTGQFSADKLYVWLAEVPVVAKSSKPASNRGSTSGPELVAPAQDPIGQQATAPLAVATTKSTTFHIRPVKMLAHGHVHVDSPQLMTDTKQLEVWFDHDQPIVRVTPNQEPSTNDADTPASEPPKSERQSRRKSIKKVELSGDLIRLRILMTKPRPWVREATITGQVRLVQRAPAPVPAPLLVVTGRMLQLQTDAWQRVTVDVTGTPARVLAQGMVLEGSNLHLSQRENRMWAGGPGRMKLPARGTASQGESMAPTPIWIAWQGGMDFDGQLVRFLRGVEVRGIHTLKKGEQLHMLATGDQLHALLNRYVAFDHPSQANELDVVELRFLGTILTKNQTFGTDGHLTSQDQIQMRDMLLDRRTGDFRGVGPGWIVSTRYGQGGFQGPMDGRSSRSPRAGSKELKYLRVDFQNEAVGNLNRREIQFQHYVRTVYGPVDSWQQTLDPDRRGGLGPEGFVMTCDRLILAEMSDGNTRSLEMKAVGNTVVEGNQFMAKADRLSYTQAKDQLVLESGGRNFALMEYRHAPGQRPSSFTARKIFYWPHTGQYEVAGGNSGDYTHFPSSNAPRARLR